ncbi:hypothetical protein KORDIASMS9_01930 [Kordia sp. SMS9]|uniref:energy transducer TonB n=1 Tax=Kordia sp. SMS9 TaxID=2282170 RepID=UPI000E10D274|nr:energy transducer TonB [Kordia sp. SMS9]AXG69703.1 hypothetical protein KORDIASMS9_01930 [Kordia sp. SMS9]
MYTGFSQNTTPTNVTAVDCQNVSDTACTKKKIHEAFFHVLNASDIKKVIHNTDKDTVFATIQLLFKKPSGKIKMAASYVRFFKEEGNPFNFDLYRKVQKLDFTIEKPASNNTFPNLTETVYFRINRQKNTLEPLYNYAPPPKPDSYVLFPGCETMTTRQDQMRCFDEKMTAHLGKHFNRDLASDLNLEGVVKIRILFNVTKYGTIRNIRVITPHSKIEDNIKEVIHLIDGFRPAIRNGMPKSTRIMIPFNFIVE